MFFELKNEKDEKAMVVKATHEAIITTELFEEVQDLLNGRKKGNFPQGKWQKKNYP